MVVTTIIMVVVVVGLVVVMIMIVGVVVGVVVVVMIMMMMIIIRAFQKLLGNILATSRIWNNFFLFEHFLEPVMVIMVTMVAMMMMMIRLMVDLGPFFVDSASRKCGLKDHAVDFETWS